MTRYIAFDIGAASGRAFTGEFDGRVLRTKEIHRFANSPKNEKDRLRWDINGIVSEIRKVLSQINGTFDAIGIDTWGVDFGLVDDNGRLLENPVAYRDRRTEGAMQSFFKKMPRNQLYNLTGIQMMKINTIFQLESMVVARDPLLQRASKLLMVPDLLNSSLCNIQCTEFTNATTTQLYNPRIRNWDCDILEAVGIRHELMPDIVNPGTVIGEAGVVPQYYIPLIAVASHDTGSAVAAVPIEGEHCAYISSGTWSLMGIESNKPIINRESYKHNVTNEGGVCGTYGVQKNIMGLWLLQCCCREWKLSYEEIVASAGKAPAFKCILDPDNSIFFDPDSMTEAINKFCEKSGQQGPASQGEFARAILESLALAYRHTLEILQEVSGRQIGVMNIVGGGSLNSLLNQFTADCTGLEVRAGPVEATAIGNLLVQAMAMGEIKDLQELRKIVRDSFPQQTYSPSRNPAWDMAYERFLKVIDHQEYEWR
jgi:rhamnulokinase